MNFTQLVGYGELEGRVHGPRFAKKPLEKPDRLFGYLDLASVSITITVPNRVAHHRVRSQVGYDLLSIHPNCQIMLKRGKCSAVGRLSLGLNVPGTAEPRRYERHAEKEKSNASSHQRAILES